MKTVFSFICCILLFSSCQDEQVEGPGEIESQLSENNAQIREAELVIEGVMEKYNAHSYDVTGLKDIDPPLASFVLRDYQKQAIEGIAADDEVRMAKAIVRIKTLRQDLSKLKDKDGVFSVVDEQPVPHGGIGAFYKYVTENLKYPLSAREKGIEGKVFVQFVVNDFGEITEVEAIKGIGGGCDAAAVEVVKNSAPWQPGRQGGEAVKVRMVIPISFKIGDA